MSRLSKSIVLLSFSFLSYASTGRKPFFSTTLEITSHRRTTIVENNVYAPFYNFSILNNDLINANFWATKWYNKFAFGVGVGTHNSGFEYYGTNDALFLSSRIVFGIKIESPILIIFSNRFDAMDDFESYYIESENEKGLHLAPYFGLNLLYLYLLGASKNSNSENMIYQNNLGPSFLIQPYFRVAIKNKSVEYISFIVKYAFGLTNAEKLTIVNSTAPNSIFYTNNSYIEVGISKNINIFFKSGQSKQRKLGGKYKGQCPK